MKIALCLHGLVGTDDKYGLGKKQINSKIAYGHFEKHLFEVNEQVDVFYHTWSKDEADVLKNLYNPVTCLHEEQPRFSNSAREQAIYCRWLSAKKSIQLMLDSGNQYDFVLLTRFDIAFMVDFNFSEFDKERFYAQGPVGPISNGIPLINDLWFFSTPDKMEKFYTLYDHLSDEEYQVHIDSNHALARKHIMSSGLDKILEYKFARPWNGVQGKRTTDTPLVRWHYFNKV